MLLVAPAPPFPVTGPSASSGGESAEVGDVPVGGLGERDRVRMASSAQGACPPPFGGVRALVARSQISAGACAKNRCIRQFRQNGARTATESQLRLKT